MKNISFEWIILQEKFHALYFVASTRLCWYDFWIHRRKRWISTPHSHNWNSLMIWSCVAITAQCPFGRHCVWHNVWYAFVQTVSFVIIVECQSIAACDEDFWKGHEKKSCVFQDTAHYLVPILLEFGVSAKCPMGKPCEKPSQPNIARFLCILSMLSSVHLCALASICDYCNRTWSYLTDLDMNSMVCRGDSTHVVLLCGTVAWRIVQCTTNWCSAKVLKLLTNFYHNVINRGRSLGWVFLSRNHQNHDSSMEFVRLECAGAWRLRSMHKRWMLKHSFCFRDKGGQPALEWWESRMSFVPRLLSGFHEWFDPWNRYDFNVLHDWCWWRGNAFVGWDLTCCGQDCLHCHCCFAWLAHLMCILK